MLYLIAFLITVLGGLIQTVTGFGSGIMMMLIFPYVFGIIKAPALSTSISLGLNIALSWKFRKYIDSKVVLAPTIAFFVTSFTIIHFVEKIKADHLYVLFGSFLIILAIYFFVFAKKTSVRPNAVTGIICGAVSGVCSGLFGIGGPMLAPYFVAATDSKESYLGNMQGLFAVTSLINTISRMQLGIYTFDLLPVTAAGIIGILIGKTLGLKILYKINAEKLPQIIYTFVAVSGAVILIEHL